MGRKEILREKGFFLHIKDIDCLKLEQGRTNRLGAADQSQICSLSHSQGNKGGLTLTSLGAGSLYSIQKYLCLPEFRLCLISNQTFK